MLSTYGLTQLEPSSTADECRFCDIEKYERLISESEHATAFPSVGAFVEGWVLVTPRQHVVALSELSHVQWDEFATLARKCNEAVRSHYGPTVLFEHGAAGANRTAGCGVDHAHLHVVPWYGNLRDQIAAVPGLGPFQWQRAGARPAVEPGFDYIWIADQTGAWITHASELPSQVVRRAIAGVLGLDSWDWKADLRLDAVSATFERLHPGA